VTQGKATINSGVFLNLNGGETPIKDQFEIPSLLIVNGIVRRDD
jgi:hypothetical protein